MLRNTKIEYLGNNIAAIAVPFLDNADEIIKIETLSHVLDNVVVFKIDNVPNLVFKLLIGGSIQLKENVKTNTSIEQFINCFTFSEGLNIDIPIHTRKAIEGTIEELLTRGDGYYNALYTAQKDEDIRQIVKKFSIDTSMRNIMKALNPDMEHKYTVDKVFNTTPVYDNTVSTTGDLSFAKEQWTQLFSMETVPSKKYSLLTIAKFLNCINIKENLHLMLIATW